MFVNNVCDVVNVQRINYWIAATGHVECIKIAGVAVILKDNSKRWCWRVTLNEGRLTDSNFLFCRKFDSHNPSHQSVEPLRFLHRPKKLVISHYNASYRTESASFPRCIPYAQKM